MTVGVKINSVIDEDESEINAKAVIVGKVYPLTVDKDGELCFVDEDDEYNYGVGCSDSAYETSFVLIEE